MYGSIDNEKRPFDAVAYKYQKRKLKITKF